MKRMIAAITAMFLGGMLYVLLRSESLAMFNWFDAIGIKEEVQILRSMARPHLSSLPLWVCFSLPQALWYLSGLLAFECIWGTSSSPRRQRQAWMLIFSILSFSLEAGQFFQVVPGHFDPLDLALLFVAWGIVAAMASLEQRRAMNYQFGGV